MHQHPFWQNQSIDGIIPKKPQVNYTYSSIREHTLYQESVTFWYHWAKFQFLNPSWALEYYVHTKIFLWPTQILLSGPQKKVLGRKWPMGRRLPTTGLELRHIVLVLPSTYWAQACYLFCLLLCRFQVKGPRDRNIQRPRQRYKDIGGQIRFKRYP